MDNSANLGLFAVHKIVSERRKNLCVHGEEAKRHKTVYFSVNNKKDFKSFKTLPIYTLWDGLSLKTI
jgi:hypothetical protein